MRAFDPAAPAAVLLSGGVDSSVALFRLKEAGFSDLTAFYLKIWLEDELSYLGNCPWEEDLAYASEVCRMAGVKLEIVPLQREYYERVVSYTVEELRAGRTPSPDLMCNSRIKFSAFYDRVKSSFACVATGHYARTDRKDGRTLLLRAPDPVKDQTYFLSHLTQSQVSGLAFPIGDLWKAEVRALARELGLPNRDRRDSQGICFLGKLRYSEFVKHYLGEKPGPIVERETGRVLGTHSGYWFHTIGQRQGLGLSGGPCYVTGKNVEENIVFVSGSTAAKEGARYDFVAGSVSWIAEAPSSSRLLLKLRHGPALIPCSVEPLAGGTLKVRMDTPDAGVAPGQFAVFYDGDECLGCGRIE